MRPLCLDVFCHDEELFDTSVVHHLSWAATRNGIAMSIDTSQKSILQSLDVIQIPSPCKMDWGLMTGDEQTRHCDHCAKNVYNISEMSEQDALALINKTEGEICVRMYRRRDGTVVTAECPPIKNYYESSGKRSWLQFSMASLLLLVTTTAGLCASAPWLDRKLRPIFDSWFGAPVQGEIMDDMIVVAPPAPTKATDPDFDVGMGGIGGAPNWNKQ